MVRLHTAEEAAEILLMIMITVRWILEIHLMKPPVKTLKKHRNQRYVAKALTLPVLDIKLRLIKL